jgi:CHAT domain-containing protein/tetratricopeptide (TPR) repeat protein
MRLALLFLLLIGIVSAKAQSTRLDSLITDSRYDEAEALVGPMIASASGADQLILLNKKAEILIAQGRLEEAQTTIEQISAAKSSDPRIEPLMLTNRGRYYMNRGRFDLALEDLTAAYQLFMRGTPNTPDLARCVGLMSITYLATGKYKLAEDNAQVALQLRSSLYGEQHEAVAASYNDLGLVYTPTDTDKALEYYEKALEIYKRLHGSTHTKIAIASTNIGILYRQLELYGDAINNLEAALAVWKTTYPDGHPNQAFVQRNLGQTYFKMGNTSTALQYFQQALDLYRRFYGDKHPEIASTLNQIGTARLEDRQYELALQDFQAAICSNIAGFSDTRVEANPPIDDYYNGNVLLYSLTLKAQGLEELHFGKTLNMSQLKLAQTTLFLADSLIDDIRHHSTDEADKISLGAMAGEVYENGVRVSTALSEIVAKPRPFKEAAFYFAEKSKSAVLQESIADTQAKSFAGIPPSLVDEEKNLKTSIALLTQKLSQKPSSEEEKYLREALVGLKHDYVSFTRKLETDYPDYYNLKFNVASPRVSELQSRLNDEQALISYFIASRDGRLYQFVITRRSFHSNHVTLPADFERSTRGFNNGIFFRAFPTFQRSGESLYNVLKPRTSKRIRELIIIPAGRLGTLPFEALPTNSRKANDFVETKYLTERYAISYEFSTGLIAQKQKEPQKSAPSIFLCAPVNFPTGQQLPPLPGTEKEVKDIQSLFSGNSKLLLNQEANEAMIKSKSISDYNFLHFATHGIVDETDPENSRIFLNENGGEDGNLFASEIYNLSLNADLAVLSACQTGLGKYSEGEGVIGLSRALVYAGAQNLIVSFWSVADESTASLMTTFYSDLVREGNNNFRHSLQAAKMEMIRSGNFREPYYWAPFILIGF